MIQSFHDDGTEDLFNGKDTRAARRTCPRELWPVLARKFTYLDSAEELRDLASPPNNRLEPLRADRKGQHSIRINDRYRICFRWTEAGPADVEVVDYH
jgi:toxin HigB-1